MQRILVVYNPNSSQYIHVKSEFLTRLKGLKSVIIGKFAVKKAPLEENVANLKKLLRPGDLVIAAGGDATAAIAVNAMMEKGVDATLSVLPFGNFNDLARTLGTMKVDDVLDLLSGAAPIQPGSRKIPATLAERRAAAIASHTAELYPFEIIINKKHWRFASGYVTMGMTAESVEIFDDPKIRKRLQQGHKSSWRSYVELALWYFKNRHSKIFIPDFTINGIPAPEKCSDYCALSGRSMCRVMKGGDDFLRPRVFRSAAYRLTSFPSLFVLMAQSILRRTPGTETSGDHLEFKKPATVELQAEGEYRTFERVREIDIYKAPRPLRVIMKGKK
ncbi:acylglycerol kinase family protein [Candidatus Saccharibacteria bacterium]|nr:acylglycerol kinase family protein [Candidatus Saccharibacteria bacterium]